MAISHTQTLLLVLVSLFFIPAALATVTTFKICRSLLPRPPYTVKVETVEISPNPIKRSGNGNITITAYASNEINDGATVILILGFAHAPIGKTAYPLCDLTACPVAAGSSFTFSLPNVFTEHHDFVVKKYNVKVGIIENQKGLICIDFDCPIVKGVYVSSA